jgi:DNA-binding CsgD family transcriptional regulator
MVVAAQRGQGGFALVEGVPGIGKSRLLAEAVRFARERGLVVATGQADELDQMTPWGALLAALGSTDPTIVSRADLMSPPGLLDRRLEVLERLRTALERAASERPLLIAIDDAHWADPSTLLALGSLAVQLFSYPIVWLLGRRPFPETVQMRALIERLARQDVARLPLGPLDAEATAALAEDLLGKRLDRELQGLVAQADGNPLYVVEIVRSAATRDQDTRGGFAGTEARVTKSLGSVVVGQMRSLPEGARRLLRMASVFGPTFSVVELSAITGQSASELFEWLAEALAAAVLVEEGSQLAFRHDLVREAVYDDIPLAVRLALHREAAAALLAQGAPVLQIAKHVAIGALPGDDGAIEALGRAIGELFGTSPPAAADLALRILELLGPDDPRRPASVATAVQLLGWAARLGEARALGEAYIADNELPAVLEAEIQLGMRRAWTTSTGQPYPIPLPDALLADETVPAVVRGNLIAFSSHTPIFHRPAEEVRETFRRAEALVEGHGDGTDQFVVQSMHISLEHEHGRLVDALAIAESPLSGHDAPSARAICVRDSTIASCLATMGRNGEALEMLARALPPASSTGSTLIVSRCQSTRATVLLELGRIDDARAEAEAAAELAENLGCGYYFAQALATLVEGALRQGDVAVATAAAKRLLAWSLNEPTGDAEWAAALCADAVGRHAAVSEALEPVVERLERGRFVFAAWYPSRLPQLVALALRAGHRDQATIGVRAASEMSRRNPGVRSAAAATKHAQGLLDSDAALLRDAVELIGQQERPLAAAAAREDLAGALMNTASSAAIEHLEGAYEIYVRCGAGRDTARVRAALRRLGVRKRQPTVARPEQGWESLTKSERTVAELVARGLTSREAASELFLSIDTINTHLRHAFAKLGIRSRVQLARLAAERERSGLASTR